MAEKDITEKQLLLQADVFADCINTLVYEGKQKLTPRDLHPAPTESFYRTGGKIHSQFSDVGYFRLQNGQIKAQYMIENEMHLKKKQVLRKMSYEGGAYRGQLASGNPAYPVISIVIDWKRKRNRIPLSLHKLLETDNAAQDELMLTDDMKLNVYHVRNLSEKIRCRFISDMGFVADYLNEGNFDRRRGQKIIHVEALCEMMRALTGDMRFTDLTEALQKREGEEIIMCEYIDMLEARGQEKGENKLAALLSKLYAQGREEDARKAVGDKNVRKRLYEELGIIC